MNIKTGKEIKKLIDEALSKESEPEELLVKYFIKNPNHVLNYMEILLQKNELNNIKIKLVILAMARAISKLQEK